MNYTVVLTLLLSIMGGGQGATTQNETLVGSVVRYDASMSSRTSQADLVLKLKVEGATKYVRLRYAPNGFGFDAPPANPEQLLPRDMFLDGNRVWTFRVHAPRTREEETACMGRVKQYAPGKNGQLVKVERFVAVPGHEREDIPKPEALSCSIVESWERSALTPARGEE